MSSDAITFHDLDLIEPVLQALDDMGHTVPTPIQAQMIPHVLAGRDVVGQAQTGTGKTGAFALPLLSLLDPELSNPQVLVLTPTRELAMQVAGAFEEYAARMEGLKVLAVYGGSNYTHQLRSLHRGVHVVVGTPGRVMDHMRRGTLILDDLSCLVLDEADEMLRMGFIDDITWILDQTPPDRQVALFSATMPPAIRRIARSHLNDPEEITIEGRTTTVEATRQRYILLSQSRKPEALGRVLEAEDADGVLVFVRTKAATVEVAEALVARGHAAAALNGDMPQDLRERTVDRLRRGKLNILVATDIAARGLDVDRLSHVINYDIPYDVEAYIHRIGRTGRAGREGDAILFVAPDQRRLLRTIEHTTKQRIERMDPPDADAINARRIAHFQQRITEARETLSQLGLFADIIHSYCAEHDVPELEVAAALAQLVQGDEPLLAQDLSRVAWIDAGSDPDRRGRGGDQRGHRQSPMQQGFERYRVALGRVHGVKPGNLVGAIANEVGIQGRAIGRIDILDEHSMVDLPAGMPDHVLTRLQKVRVFGVPLQMTKCDDADAPPARHYKRGGGSFGPRQPRRPR